jgi:tetratricopeptide (TPR) repeat protein
MSAAAERSSTATPPWAQTLAGILLLLVLAFGIDRLRERTTARLSKVKETIDVYSLPSPAYVERASLGYRDAVASILWAAVLYDYGDHVLHNRGFLYSTQYVKTIVHLDPSFTPAYKFLGTFLTMQAAAPDRAQLDEARRIFTNATVERPNDPDVWAAYATFMMFEGAQFLPKGDEKNEWRKQGALAAQRAVELGFMSDNLALSGVTYLEAGGLRDLAIAQLERNYALAPNDAAREQIAAKLQRMQASSTIEKLNAGISRFLRSWRDDASFAPEGLFVQVGPRRDVFACTGKVGDDPRCAPGWAGTGAR